jgi:hypothetical protein
MVQALRMLPRQKRPSEVVVPGLLDGLPNVNRLMARHLARPRLRDRFAVAQNARAS